MNPHMQTQAHFEQPTTSFYVEGLIIVSSLPGQIRITTRSFHDVFWTLTTYTMSRRPQPSGETEGAPRKIQEEEHDCDLQHPYPRAVDIRAVPGAVMRHGMAGAGTHD